jgi:ribosomal protein S18 acetylase RimI-like enzyme
MQNVKIRDFKDSDSDQLRTLVVESDVYQKKELEKEKLDIAALKEGASRLFDLNIKNSERHYIVAIEGSVVVGYVLVETNSVYVGKGAIVDFFVVSEKRGQGIGTKLIEAGTNWLRRKGIEQADIAVHNSNQVAIKLYKGLGFVDDPDDYVYLTKNI